MYSITKEFKFCCAHRLFHLEKGHKCRNLHGHNYKVNVSIYSKTLDKDQFVIDFGELKSFQKFLDLEWDHRVIISNDDEELLEFCKKLGTDHHVFSYAVTAENMAKFFAQMIYYKFENKINIDKVLVTVYETDKNYATYEFSGENV